MSGNSPEVLAVTPAGLKKSAAHRGPLLLTLPNQERLVKLSKFDNFPNLGISQEWGKHSWDVASQSPITSADVETASEQAIATLDESFFRVRFDRLTLAEKKYLRGMADLGAGPHRSGDIAASLARKVSTLAPLRSALIEKGMIYSPNHGDTAFTVPLFDEFMRRIMPGDDWRMG